ncbi:hypothetical protein BDP81DRAFT_117193 [Colletotrichum phormii]|uniref:Secreted protein n=1 Tax=Colletotrichum phormii TaxID=359342 RepID=A0AAI9ZG04_9PEZI|nr:uncharacterized protein BDP81DRAFT_117193 [Colletotrichum phormii]KAK1623756.1 hypothetical protein BDP81DRAFT_117193 [Colletotrichum phormii]
MVLVTPANLLLAQFCNADVANVVPLQPPARVFTTLATNVALSESSLLAPEPLGPNRSPDLCKRTRALGAMLARGRTQGPFSSKWSLPP